MFLSEVKGVVLIALAFHSVIFGFNDFSFVLDICARTVSNEGKV